MDAERDGARVDTASAMVSTQYGRSLDDLVDALRTHAFAHGRAFSTADISRGLICNGLNLQKTVSGLGLPPMTLVPVPKPPAPTGAPTLRNGKLLIVVPGYEIVNQFGALFVNYHIVCSEGDEAWEVYRRWRMLRAAYDALSVTHAELLASPRLPTFEPHGWWRVGPLALEPAFLAQRAAMMQALLQALVRELDCSVLRHSAPPPLLALLVGPDMQRVSPAASAAAAEKAVGRMTGIKAERVPSFGIAAPREDGSPTGTHSSAVSTDLTTMTMADAPPATQAVQSLEESLEDAPSPLVLPSAPPSDLEQLLREDPLAPDPPPASSEAVPTPSKPAAPPSAATPTPESPQPIKISDPVAVAAAALPFDETDVDWASPALVPSLTAVEEEEEEEYEEEEEE